MRDVVQGRRQDGAKTAARTAAVHVPTSAPPSEAGELAGVAQRANAGPHATSLAAAASVVAQRKCADCERVKETMGSAAPVKREADVMGARAARIGTAQRVAAGDHRQTGGGAAFGQAVTQRMKRRGSSVKRKPKKVKLEHEEVQHEEVQAEQVLEQAQEKEPAPELAKEKDEVAEKSELAGLSMAELLKKAFTQALPKKYGKNLPLFNLLLDVGEGELRAMSFDAAVMKLPEYYKDWLMYTSCHNTAQKLFSRMGSPEGEAGAFMGFDKDEAKEQEDGAWLKKTSGALAESISSDVMGDARSIYEVHAGGHGFVVLVREGKGEIVQSFANAVSLVERMERGPLVLPSGKIEEVVANLASPETEARDAAAQIVADCNASVFGLEPYPAFQYRWRRHELRSDQDLLDSFSKDLKSSFQFLKKSYGDLLNL